MNNPNSLSQSERAITPGSLFNKGINVHMSKERRAKKKARHVANVSARKMEA